MYKIKDSRMLKYILGEIKHIHEQSLDIMKFESEKSAKYLALDLLYLKGLINDFIEEKGD